MGSISQLRDFMGLDTTLYKAAGLYKNDLYTTLNDARSTHLKHYAHKLTALGQAQQHLETERAEIETQLNAALAFENDASKNQYTLAHVLTNTAQGQPVPRDGASHFIQCNDHTVQARVDLFFQYLPAVEKNPQDISIKFPTLNDAELIELKNNLSAKPANTGAVAISELKTDMIKYIDSISKRINFVKTFLKSRTDSPTILNLWADSSNSSETEQAYKAALSSYLALQEKINQEDAYVVWCCEKNKQLPEESVYPNRSAFLKARIDFVQEYINDTYLSSSSSSSSSNILPFQFQIVSTHSVNWSEESGNLTKKFAEYEAVVKKINDLGKENKRLLHILDILNAANDFTNNATNVDTPDDIKGSAEALAYKLKSKNAEIKQIKDKRAELSKESHYGEMVKKFTDSTNSLTELNNIYANNHGHNSQLNAPITTQAYNIVTNNQNDDADIEKRAKAIINLNTMLEDPLNKRKLDERSIDYKDTHKGKVAAGGARANFIEYHQKNPNTSSIDIEVKKTYHGTISKSNLSSVIVTARGFEEDPTTHQPINVQQFDDVKKNALAFFNQHPITKAHALGDWELVFLPCQANGVMPMMKKHKTNQNLVPTPLLASEVNGATAVLTQLIVAYAHSLKYEHINVPKEQISEPPTSDPSKPTPAKELLTQLSKAGVALHKLPTPLAPRLRP